MKYFSLAFEMNEEEDYLQRKQNTATDLHNVSLPNPDWYLTSRFLFARWLIMMTELTVSGPRGNMRCQEMRSTCWFRLKLTWSM